MLDFTLKKYKQLLAVFAQSDYSFQTFEEFLKLPKEKVIILRHDVDALPQNSLNFARLQASFGIKGVYYFRMVSGSWNADIIKEIANLGHEIGYHYENLALYKGDLKASILDFEKNLQLFRTIVPVSTICMHGSPISKYDSKDLWKIYDYKKFEIIGEPYFDLDFDKILYLTDTGRTWFGQNVSVRDKVETIYDFRFKTTDEIIEALQNSKLPPQIMFTFHPQRWSDNMFLWTKELIFQNLKNILKKIYFVDNQYIID